MSEAQEKPGRESAHTDLAWRIVGLTNIYRLLVVLVLLVLHLLTEPTPTFGGAAPPLFRLILLIYFVLAILLALAGRRHWPGRRTLVLAHAIIDAGAIATLMYASGGVSSKLGVLLVIPLGLMALPGPGHRGLIISAVARLPILV